MTSRPLLVALLLTAVLALSPPASADTDPVGVWPLVPEPEVVHGFDPPDDPWGAGHRGVDLLGVAGGPVSAALPGRVSWAGVLAGRGVVVVDHGDTRTTYEPVDATVEVGVAVGAGDRIGTLGLVGSHCLPHACLHWGWLAGETYLDPLRLVGAGPVRLLPLWRDEPLGTTPLVARPSYAGWRAPLELFTRGGEPAGRPAAAGPW
jgi:murein DD-endopeptidase MepM/ murein hydrolase activator NlpD